MQFERSAPASSRWSRLEDGQAMFGDTRTMRWTFSDQPEIEVVARGNSPEFSPLTEGCLELRALS